MGFCCVARKELIDLLVVPGLITLIQKIMQGQCVEYRDSGKIN